MLAAGIGFVLLCARWTGRRVLRPVAASQAVPDVVYIPTPQPVVDAMLQVADVKRRDVVYDLGSGDGRIVITAAKKYGARGVGIEIDPALVKKATENAAAAGVSDRVRFVTQNLFTADISEATVVTLYLLQSINERLRPKLVRELKAGDARRVARVQHGPEWPPEKHVRGRAKPRFLLDDPGALSAPGANQPSRGFRRSWLHVHLPSRWTRVRLTEYLYLSAR